MFLCYQSIKKSQAYCIKIKKFINAYSGKVIQIYPR